MSENGVDDPRPGSRQALRRPGRSRRDRPRRQAGRGLRLPRPERGWQELDDAHDRLRLAGERGTLRILGLDPATDGPQIRARLGVVPSWTRSTSELTVRENVLIYGCYFGLAGARAEAAHRRAARLRAADRARRRQGRAALGRDEAPAHDRTLARQRPRPAPARRAHDRARPAGAPRRLGPPLPPQAAGRDVRRDHALHGRGGAALRPARRHGPSARSSPKARRGS